MFQFPPRAIRGVLMGFTLAQIAMVAAALLAAVIGLNLLAAGGTGVGWGMFALTVLLILLALLRFKGRRLTEWLPIVAAALVQRAAGQSEYRGGPWAPN